jgi:hypothetical protein
MSPRVVIYQIPRHHRSLVVCEAMADGLKRHGINPIRRFENEYTGIEGDIAVFYGLEGRLKRLFRDYREHAKAAYIDLGYWKRKEPKARFDGYHKIVINDRHPTEYFQRRQHDDSRSRWMDVKIKPWNQGDGHILIAGMGDKAAEAEGYEFEQWERWCIKNLRKVCNRSIVYRPKPSCKAARPISGVGYSPKTTELSHALRDCYAVFTHHSNVAVEALCLGIPVWCWKGVAVPFASQDFTQLKRPVMKEGREQWVNDIAWCQWNTAEMRSGLAWMHLKEEGLV